MPGRPSGCYVAFEPQGTRLRHLPTRSLGLALSARYRPPLSPSADTRPQARGPKIVCCIIVKPFHTSLRTHAYTRGPCRHRDNVITGHPMAQISQAAPVLPPSPSQPVPFSSPALPPPSENFSEGQMAIIILVLGVLWLLGQCLWRCLRGLWPSAQWVHLPGGFGIVEIDPCRGLHNSWSVASALDTGRRPRRRDYRRRHELRDAADDSLMGLERPSPPGSPDGFLHAVAVSSSRRSSTSSTSGANTSCCTTLPEDAAAAPTAPPHAIELSLLAAERSREL